MVEPRCIIFGHTKKFFPQNEEKTKRIKLSCLMDENAHMHLHMGFIRTLLFFTIFTIFFPFLMDVASTILFYFFDLLGRQPVYVLILFFFFFNFY